VAIACGHSIAGPARAAIPFTSGETPLAYLLLKAGHKKAHKAQNDLKEEFENESEITNLQINSHFVLFVLFRG
jgi:hypothetical protein